MITLTLTGDPGTGKGVLLDAIYELLTANGIKARLISTSFRREKFFEYVLEVESSIRQFERVKQYYMDLNDLHR